MIASIQALGWQMWRFVMSSVFGQIYNLLLLVMRSARVYITYIMKSRFNLGGLGVGELAPPERHEIDAEIRRQNPDANPDVPNTPSNGIQWLFWGRNMPDSAPDRADWVIVSPFRVEFVGSTKDDGSES